MRGIAEFNHKKYTELILMPFWRLALNNIEHVLDNNLTFRRRRVRTKGQGDPFVFLGSLCV